MSPPFTANWRSSSTACCSGGACNVHDQVNIHWLHVPLTFPIPCQEFSGSLLQLNASTIFYRVSDKTLSKSCPPTFHWETFLILQRELVPVRATRRGKQRRLARTISSMGSKPGQGVSRPQYRNSNTPCMQAVLVFGMGTWKTIRSRGNQKKKMFVGWFVGRITERLLSRFSQNKDRGWVLARKRPH